MQIEDIPTESIIKELQRRGYRLSVKLMKEKPLVFMARVMGYLKGKPNAD